MISSKVQDTKSSTRNLDAAKPGSNTEYYKYQMVTTGLSRSWENGSVFESYISDASPKRDHLSAIDHSTHSFVNNNNETKTPETNKQSWESILSKAYKRKWVGFRYMDGRNCLKALASNATNDMFQHKVKRIRDIPYTNDPGKCWKFRAFFGFNRYPEVSEQERRFPIAFIILFHNNIDQVLFLLRAIYRPHNVYCLAMDAKNTEAYISYIKTVFQCLSNVFVASKLEKIVYAGFSRLMADIHCMHDLLEHPIQWQYVINMPGQQFPIKTNLELVKILTILNGSNNIELMPSSASIPNRYKIKHIIKKNPVSGYMYLAATNETLGLPPHNITIIKGSTYGCFSRDFVQFALHHPIAKEFLNYSKHFKSPDEYFWSTLQHTNVVHVPGGVATPRGDIQIFHQFSCVHHRVDRLLSFLSYHHHHVPCREAWAVMFRKLTRSPVMDQYCVVVSNMPCASKKYITSFSIWKFNETSVCYGKFVHRICIFSPEDLPIIIKKNMLFANKFYIYYHPAALHCLDQWLYNRTVAGVVGDLSYYKNLDNNNTTSRPITLDSEHFYTTSIMSDVDKLGRS